MRRFRLGNAVNAPARRRFRLTEPAPVEAPYAPAPAIGKPFVPRAWGTGFAAPVKAQVPKAPARRRVQAQTTRGASVTVNAPVGPRKGRRVLSFTAASEVDVPAFLGTLRLKCDGDSVDLERVTLGVMSLCVDHIQSLLIGRVTSATIGGGALAMQAEVSESPYARRILAEIDDLVRVGFSPGFIPKKTEALSESDPAYDPDEFAQVVVSSWLPYEVSNCACPRNPNARLRGEASMMNADRNLDPTLTAPPLVNIDDPIGLSLSAGRMALKSRRGSARQRRNLGKFFAAYDDAVARGEGRDSAAQLAKEAAGLS